MDTILKMARRYARRVGSPYCLAFLKLGDKPQDKDILDLPRVSPLYAQGSTAYFEDAQLAALFSKRADLNLAIDPALNCARKWLEAERECRVTNDRLRRIDRRRGPLPLCDHAVEEFLLAVRDTITGWLGPAPSLSDLEPKFGPGSTTSRRANSATLPDKISHVPDSTLELAIAYESTFPLTGWGRHLVENLHGISPFRPHLINVVECAQFRTVEKKAEIDRPIEIQADLNVALQLSVGRVLRERLRRVGLDLNKNQDVHRRYAYEASISGTYSTIDLSSASDTISYKLVEAILPKEWFELLDLLRHKRVQMGDKKVLLEKFSGMGNGYTFELETLIFMAICHECALRAGVRPKVGRNLLVYGDDIIIESVYYTRAVRTLRLLGFTVNTEKSFNAEVAFKESCGGDYFKGKWVRPAYLKEHPNEPHQWITLANAVRRVGINHYGVDFWVYSPLYRFYLDCIGAIPLTHRVYGPERFGDTVLHSTDRAQYVVRARKNRLYLRNVRFVPMRGGQRNRGAYVEWDNFPDRTRFFSSMYLLLSGQTTEDSGALPRAPVGGYKLGWVHFETLGF